ncbi:MAG TPA: histidine kinase dimerization/phospho-acceptor domain-containing protein [Mucilaginibacter sp.]|nr:histidine kinase dimerization/phospho-acceptor domain-containing protein [Mucilaginibacter sp.]
MSPTLSRLLACSCIIVTLFSCNQIPHNDNAPSQNSSETAALILHGKDFQSGNIDSLKQIAQKLLKIAEPGNDKTALIYGRIFTAEYYWQSGDHKTSMAMAMESLADAEKANLRSAYPEIYGLIANLHKENTNFDMAFSSAEKGLNWAKASRDTNGIISLLNLKAMLIHAYAQTVPTAVKTDSSINLQFAALKIAESNPKFERLCIKFYDNISKYYLDTKDYEKAIFFGSKGAALGLKHGQQRSLTYSYDFVGRAFYYSGNKQKGLDYLFNALKIARNIKEPYREMEIYTALYDCNYLSGNYKKAIQYDRLSENIRDSLQVNLNEKQISELEIKYETTKKDKEIALLDRAGKVKNRQLLIVIAGSILGIIFSIILILQYRVISRNNRAIKLSNKQKDTALENIAFIQAHELRRPLASIMGLINVIKATDYEFDEDCLSNLEKAALELDEKIHDVLDYVHMHA